MATIKNKQASFFNQLVIEVHLPSAIQMHSLPTVDYQHTTHHFAMWAEGRMHFENIYWVVLKPEHFYFKVA